VLKTFRALPTEARAREMKPRDFLWCALNLALDQEEELSRLCPACRKEAEEGHCPVCGAAVGETEENAAFDWERFRRLAQGELI